MDCYFASMNRSNFIQCYGSGSAVGSTNGRGQQQAFRYSNSQSRSQNKQGRSVAIDRTSRGQMLTALSAELALRQEERQPGFSVTLLQIVAAPDCDDVTRLASSLYFKNFIRRWWTVRA